MPKRKTSVQETPEALAAQDEKDRSRRDDDSLWKDIIERFFYPMLARAIPTLYADADRTKQPKFLDKELKKATYQLKAGKRTVDLLAEVPLKNGDSEWLLLHCEVQGHGGEDLPLRMHRYRSLIFCMFGREPAALAIETDRRSESAPVFYESELYNTVATYRYNRLVVPELDEGELLASDNPFDLALCAAQRALLSGKDEQKKHAYLRGLLGLLADRGWSHEDKHRLLLFIENIINLKDKALYLDIVEYEEELEKEGKIMYVTLYERVRGPQWKEEGRMLGKLETARNLLKMGMTVEQIVKATELPEEEVRKLLN